MPIITFESPKLTKEQKEQAVKKFTETASQILNMPKESFIVLIKESEPDNVGVGGELLSERIKK